MSVTNTRRRRCIQLMALMGAVGVASWGSGGAVGVCLATMCWRCLACGANGKYFVNDDGEILFDLSKDERERANLVKPCNSRQYARSSRRGNAPFHLSRMTPPTSSLTHGPIWLIPAEPNHLAGSNVRPRREVRSNSCADPRPGAKAVPSLACGATHRSSSIQCLGSRHKQPLVQSVQIPRKSAEWT
jgi:hypothetical protein